MDRKLNPRTARHRCGFNIIELLMSMMIILLLLSITVPSVTATKRLARRVQCASNLNVWGKAMGMYSADNVSFVPGSWKRGSDPRRIWDERFLDDGGSSPTEEQTALQLGEMTMQMVAPDYLDGFNPDQNTLDGAWLCPNAVRNKVDMTTAWNADKSNPDSSHIMLYSYFAGVRRNGVRSATSDWLPGELGWADTNVLRVPPSGSEYKLDPTVTNPPFPHEYEHMLTWDSLDPDRILMADTIFQNMKSNDRYWRYNHGYGNLPSNFSGSGSTSLGAEDLDRYEGGNHLYGSGHVFFLGPGQLDENGYIQDPDTDGLFVENTSENPKFRNYWAQRLDLY